MTKRNNKIIYFYEKTYKEKIISIFIVIGLLITPITFSSSYAQWFGGKVIKYGSIMVFTGLTDLLINHYSQKINPLKDIITIDTEKIKESYLIVRKFFPLFLEGININIIIFIDKYLSIKYT